METTTTTEDTTMATLHILHPGDNDPEVEASWEGTEATAEQIVAAIRDPFGTVAIHPEDGTVLRPGQFGWENRLSVWIDVPDELFVEIDDAVLDVAEVDDDDLADLVAGGELLIRAEAGERVKWEA